LIPRFRSVVGNVNQSCQIKLRSHHDISLPPIFETSYLQEVNEHGFKLLQEYLAASETSNRTEVAASVPYAFTFIIKFPDSSTLDKFETKKVSVTLPPPIKSKPDETRLALNKLLTACGVEAVEKSEHNDGNGNNGNSMSLRYWLPMAVELYHKSLASRGTLETEMHAVKMAYRLAHKKPLIISNEIRHSTETTLEAAKRIYRLVTENKHLNGLRIGLTHGFGLDEYGTLWLDVSSEYDAWLEYLHKTDLDMIRHRLQTIDNLKESERELATALGIELVVPAPALLISDCRDYQTFLDSTAQAAEKAYDFPMKNLSQVVLEIQPSLPPSSGEETIKNSSLDGSGKISVGVEYPGSIIINVLRTSGPTAARHAQIARKQQEEVELMKRKVERSLRLRSLHAHPDLPVHKFTAGCLRLLERSQQLGPILEGLPIRLAEVNYYRPGLPHIDVSWSFLN
jgi:hypothetical protein